MRYPWAAAGHGRATSGRPTLQTSSNQRNSNRLTRTPVTNVVNLSPKTTIFSEKALGLTTFVTTGQKSTRKIPPIDDVRNNTHQSTPKTQHARPLRHPQEAERPGCGAHGQRRHHRHPNVARNLSRSFFETPQKRCNSNDTNSMLEQAAGELRAKLMGGGSSCPDNESTRRAHISNPAPPVCRAPEDPEGTAAMPLGSVGA